jgi:C4-dicarboxylate-binding protein DctP
MKASNISTAQILGKVTRLVLLSTLFTTLAACDNDEPDGPVVIKFSHVTAPATPKGQAADRFQALVNERLEGRVKIEVYPSGQLMNDDDSIDALAFGEIQMIAVSLSKFDRLTHQFQLFDLPFLFSDLRAVERFQGSAEGQQLLMSMSNRGLLGLTFWHNGMKQFSAPLPLRTPEAAKDLKFRIMESDVLQEQILEIGGNPQKMAFGEVYQALQTGAVDAQENTWSNIYSSKFYEVQPFLTETNHGYFGYLVAVNSSFWTALPDDLRVEIEAILDEVTIWANEQSASINIAAKEKIIASGSSEIVSLSDAELERWRSATRPVWKRFEETIGVDMIEAAQRAPQ